MIQEVIARLAHGEEPLQPGRSLPPAFKQKALELIYRKIELGLVDVLVRQKLLEFSGLLIWESAS
jgi:hypothetical protein